MRAIRSQRIKEFNCDISTIEALANEDTHESVGDYGQGGV
jgi:hypothetical protein